MKQTSDSAVRPRRDLLAALGVSAITLWGAPTLLSAAETAKKAPSVSPVDKYAFTILIGRCCVDKGFREEFLNAKDLDAATALLKKYKMPVSTTVTKWVTAIFKDTKQLRSLEEACKNVEHAATVMKKELPPPCNPWPC